jgi:hypothetical protein
MGGEGSGRKVSFKSKLILLAIDCQIFNQDIIECINDGKTSLDEISAKLLDRQKLLRRTCEENERLK